ncbi:MAG: GatB/YqeY domain-containing protein [Patescibacteria group bacterium]|nr:GatB/YqeY domain-containing protein [Patescibacteria group bacterium]
MLQEKIKTDLKEAMKNKDNFQMTVLRGILAGFTNEIISQKRKPQEEISDEDAVDVIKKEAKQRKDSIEQFTKGNRDDLADIEKKELEILEKYLPAMMEPDEILKIANTKKTELKIDDSSKIGILIGAVLKEIKTVGANADGNEVKIIVEKLFS